MQEEFEAIGAPPYDQRGAVGSEYIQAFQTGTLEGTLERMRYFVEEVLPLVEQ